MTCFSLRGTVEFADNSILDPVRVFDYVSPDRARAWKVVRAVMWPVGIRESVGGDADAKYITQSALMTDNKKGVVWNNITDPTENRSFGWAMWGGYTRENGGSDFITGETQQFSEYWVDPDTIIVKELWITFANSKEGTTNPVRKWGYMIELEEKKITPAQSVFQQIKGIGQDIDG